MTADVDAKADSTKMQPYFVPSEWSVKIYFLSEFVEVLDQK